MKRTGIDKVLADPRTRSVAYWLLLAAILLVYWLFNRRYVGPVYLTDEIGYLTKAAAFAGYPVDMATDWHGGYSLMLAPVFQLFSNPFAVWQGIIALNAAIWAASFALLFHLLRRLFPERSFWAVFAAVAFSAAYPAWITMSGYAFPTPGFVLVFMLSVLALASMPPRSSVSLQSVVFSVLVGFLYWVHPTGLAVAAASVLVIGMWTWVNRRPALIVMHGVIVAGMIATYQFAVHPWLNEVMTPLGTEPGGHYQEPAALLRSLLDAEVFLAVAVALMGQLSYLLVSSLGVVSFGVREACERVIFLVQERARSVEVQVSQLIPGFCLFSVLGIVSMGALAFGGTATSDGLRVDHWIYGRYAEMALLPLFGIGLVAAWRMSWFVLSACVVLVTALLFVAYVDQSNTWNLIYDTMIPSFWPKPVWPDAGHPWWFMAGAGAVFAAGILGKRYMPLLALPLFAVAIANQASGHWWNTVSGNTNPTSLVGFIRQNFNPGGCIGFDMRRPANSSHASQQRRNLYSFYFYNYDFRRMTPAEWLTVCDGPYLTFYGRQLAENPNVLAIARLKSSGLYLVVKNEMMSRLVLPANIAEEGDIYWNLTGRDPCSLNGCLQRSAEELIHSSQVGVLVDGRLRSDGEKGFLFYGPYVPLAEGEYVIEIDGRFPRVGGAVLDVVSERGGEVHVQHQLSEYGREIGQELVVPFVLSSPVEDLEVRLRVTSSSHIGVEGYTIKMQDY